MRTRSLLVVLILLLTAAFVAVNWSAITAPTKLSLVLTTVEAPVGLVLLGILVLIVLAFGAYLVVWQSALLLESRRQSKELQGQRALADQAESSRFTELHDFVQAEFARLDERIAQISEGLRAEIKDSANSVAATIGELDDRIHRSQGGQTS
jgi:uncharacterized integral membrane protein